VIKNLKSGWGGINLPSSFGSCFSCSTFCFHSSSTFFLVSSIILADCDSGVANNTAYIPADIAAGLIFYQPASFGSQLPG
jgi:hypothetical protein